MRRFCVHAILLGILPVTLAVGVWRGARDRPLWLELGAPPIPPAPARFLPDPPRLVLAVHYPWYGTPDGPTRRWRHWHHPRLEMPEERIIGFHGPGRLVGLGRVDIGATHYPEAGPYDSRDPARIRAQVAMAQAAGLDGFVVSWWGRESEEALGLDALFRHAAEAGLLL